MGPLLIINEVKKLYKWPYKWVNEFFFHPLYTWSYGLIFVCLWNCHQTTETRSRGGGQRKSRKRNMLDKWCFFFPCGTWASFFHRWLMVVSRFCPDMLREYPKIAQGVRQSNSWRKLLHSQGERDFLDCSFQGMLEVLKVMTSIGGSWDNWLMISWKLLKDTPNATVPPKKYGLRQAGIRIPMMIKYSRERKGKGSQCWNTLHEKVNKSYPKVCRDWWWITKYELHYIWIIGKETLEIHGDLVQVYDMYLTNLWSIAQKFNF